MTATWCHRIFSSAVYEHHFGEWSEPEISRMPLDSVCLRLKCLGIENLQSFPFPTPPPADALAHAVKLLQVLGLLDAAGKCTKLGVSVAKVPASPRLGLMLVLGRQAGVLPHTAVLVAALSVGDPFMQQQQARTDKDAAAASEDEDTSADAEADEADSQQAGAGGHGVFAHPRSDILAILRAAGAYEYEKFTARQQFDAASHLLPTADQQVGQQPPVPRRRGRNGVRVLSGAENAAAAAALAFSDRYSLNSKRMAEISSLQAQLRGDSAVTGRGAASSSLLPVTPPTGPEDTLLRQLVTAAYIDRVARLMPLPPGSSYHATRGAAYLTARPTDAAPSGSSAAATGSEEGGPPKPRVWLHRGSALHSARTDSVAEWVTYHEVAEVAVARHRKGLGMAERRVLKLVTEVDPRWLAHFARHAPALCRFSDPLPAPAAHYKPSRDQVMCYVRPTFGFGGVGWSLPPYLTPVLAGSRPQIAAVGGGADRDDDDDDDDDDGAASRLLGQTGLFAPTHTTATTLAYCVFARAVLEGTVLPALVSLQPYWVSRPELVTRPNSLAERKTYALVEALQSAGVCCRRALVEQLRAQPNFLLQPIKQWVGLPKRHLLDRIWPMLLRDGRA
eukprot:SAG22_NODE_258_length_13522_cov_6.989496_10_plen_618_part_00